MKGGAWLLLTLCLCLSGRVGAYDRIDRFVDAVLELNPELRTLLRRFVQQRISGRTARQSLGSGGFQGLLESLGGSLVFGPDSGDSTVQQAASFIRGLSQLDRLQCVPRMICSATAGAVGPQPTTTPAPIGLPGGIGPPAPPNVRPPAPPIQSPTRPPAPPIRPAAASPGQVGFQRPFSVFNPAGPPLSSRRSYESRDTPRYQRTRHGYSPEYRSNGVYPNWRGERTVGEGASSGRVVFTDERRPDWSGRSLGNEIDAVGTSPGGSDAAGGKIEPVLRPPPRTGVAAESARSGGGGVVHFPHSRQKRFTNLVNSVLSAVDSMARPFSFYPYTHAALMGGMTESRERCAQLYSTCPTTRDDFINVFNNMNRYFPGGLQSFMPDFQFRVPALDAFRPGGLQ